ncbi:16S rRNA (adenine(1518)-N(6)/adenine(1519)-N(6))-dimethyltransferase RsmA [Desulfocurvibacter africanus]|uniref:Ribosomal RNA small subunit methyltransferase A n=1 Tax=Desulfocurvibacter africanus subsp. africanus str. Walvis Bay TaxID=690850 RepID=F3Z2Z6_DESAF|nr:16S rRNA (adenine(1518)-N(6)/adenine(1519)-N(6))-dimethyltransferase RsmA [Desulfocurvibacter africanus]EGJ51404.1 Ribosomal RNA small subunit methyltransferase A [Desulfocurvibacter africanus subsp. africanus str. Walvis Bay]
MRAADGKPFAKRSLGQNFLQDENIARKIVAALELQEGDTVVEIGPGRGALTRWLDESPAQRVLALEKDKDLAQQLGMVHPRVEIVVADALRYSWEELAGVESLKYIGNLPYNIASPLMWEIVSRSPRYSRAVFMVQHEVGLRLTACPGNKSYGALSAWIQSFANVRYLFRVPPQVFRPKPKVDSAVLCFEPLAKEIRPTHPALLAKLLHICFQKRRKQLRNILRDWWGERVGTSAGEFIKLAEARPEELTPKEFQRLALLIWGDE